LDDREQRASANVSHACLRWFRTSMLWGLRLGDIVPFLQVIQGDEQRGLS
jgi:hypothetical protein